MSVNKITNLKENINKYFGFVVSYRPRNNTKEKYYIDTKTIFSKERSYRSKYFIGEIPHVEETLRYPRRFYYLVRYTWNDNDNSIKEVQIVDRFLKKLYPDGLQVDEKTGKVKMIGEKKYRDIILPFGENEENAKIEEDREGNVIADFILQNSTINKSKEDKLGVVVFIDNPNSSYCYRKYFNNAILGYEHSMDNVEKMKYRAKSKYGDILRVDYLDSDRTLVEFPIEKIRKLEIVDEGLHIFWQIRSGVSVKSLDKAQEENEDDIIEYLVMLTSYYKSDLLMRNLRNLINTFKIYKQKTIFKLYHICMLELTMLQDAYKRLYLINENLDLINLLYDEMISCIDCILYYQIEKSDIIRILVLLYNKACLFLNMQAYNQASETISRWKSLYNKYPSIKKLFESSKLEIDSMEASCKYSNEVYELLDFGDNKISNYILYLLKKNPLNGDNVITFESSEEKKWWDIVGYYNDLYNKGIIIEKDIKLELKRVNKIILDVLKKEAYNSINNGTVEGRYRCQYLCELSMSFNVNEQMALAASSALVIERVDDLNKIIDGEYSFLDVLQKAYKENKIDLLIQGIIQIGAREDNMCCMVRECMNSKLLNEKIFASLYEGFEKYIGIADLLKDGDKLTKAIKAYTESHDVFFSSFYPNYIEYAKKCLTSLKRNNPLDHIEKDRKESLINCFTEIIKTKQCSSLRNVNDSILRIIKNPDEPTSITYNEIYMLFLRYFNYVICRRIRRYNRSTNPSITFRHPEYNVADDFGNGHFQLTVPFKYNNYPDTIIDEMIPEIISEDDVQIDNDGITINTDDINMFMEIPVLKTGKSKQICIQVQIQHKKARIFVTKQFSEFGNQVFYRIQQEEKDTVFPKHEKERYVFDIKEVKMHSLNTARVEQFNRSGNINFQYEGIRRILNNRNDLVNEAINALTVKHSNNVKLNSEGCWVVIFGQWRVGKTVLINSIIDKLTNLDALNQNIIVKLSCNVADKKNFEDEFAQDIFRAIRSEMRKPLYREKYMDKFFETLDYCGIQEKNRISWGEFCVFVKALIEAIRTVDENSRLILFVDEFTAVYSAIIHGNAGEMFPQRWCNMIYETGLLCVTAGGEHSILFMEAYAPNVFQKVTNRIKVDYLNEQNVSDYLHYVLYETEEDNLDGCGIYIRPESKPAIKQVFKLTRGNAFLLKLISESLILYLTENNQRNALRINDIKKAIDIMVDKNMDVESLERDYFHSLYNPFGENEIAEETDEEKDISYDIVNAIFQSSGAINPTCSFTYIQNQICSKTIDDDFLSHLNELIDQGIIIRDKDNVSISIGTCLSLITSRNNGEVKRKIDDKVFCDNRIILHEIVKKADTITHSCTYNSLRDSVVNEYNMSDKIFDKRYRMLKDRKIIIEDKNHNVSVYIDLYYEIMNRCFEK